MQAILVVDDDPGIRDALARLLEDAGHEVLAAPGGLEALEAVARDSPDLVITDLYISGLDGAGLIARLRSERPDLPIIVVSAGIRVSPPDGVPFFAKAIRQRAPAGHRRVAPRPLTTSDPKPRMGPTREFGNRYQERACDHPSGR